MLQYTLGSLLLFLKVHSIQLFRFFVRKLWHKVDLHNGREPFIFSRLLIFGPIDKKK